MPRWGTSGPAVPARSWCGPRLRLERCGYVRYPRRRERSGGEIMKLTHRGAVVPVAAVVSVLAAFTFAAPAGGAPVTAVPSVKVMATVAVGARPLAVAVNPLANTVYVANAHGHSVSVINGQTNTVV